MYLNIIFLFLVFVALMFSVVYAYDILLVGKVPFVSLQKDTIAEIIKTLKIMPNKNFYDLGCGDARVLIEAAKIQPKANYYGVEKSIRAYILAKFKTRHYANIAIRYGNLKKVNLNKVDIVFLYLMPELLAEILPKLEILQKKDGQIIAVEFGLAKIKPKEIYYLKHPSKYAHRWYLYAN